MDTLILTTWLQKSLLLFSKKRFFWCICLGFFCISASAQKDEEKPQPLFGVHYATIITADILSTDLVIKEQNNIQFGYQSDYSHSFGGLIKFAPYQTFSFITGISTTRRNYSVLIDADTMNFSRRLRINSYQIPLLGAVNVQASKKMWMSAEGGLVLDVFPNNQGFLSKPFVVVSERRYWIMPSIKGSAKATFTNKTQGGFFIGASYQRALSTMAIFAMDYEQTNTTTTERFSVQGHYFSVDVGYYFGRPQ